MYMHPLRTEDTYEDINGVKHPRFRIYSCDCGSEHKLDTYRNIWLY